jgi:hypothetical protein
MRLFFSIRLSSAPALGKEETEDLNALFADIVEATHKSGSKGLFKGFRKKWNSFIATLNTCATILLLLFLPVLCSLAVSYAFMFPQKKQTEMHTYTSGQTDRQTDRQRKENIIKRAEYICV